MMTKGDLIKLIEPYTDDIPIFLFRDGYRFTPEVFYSNKWMSNGACIIIDANQLLAKNLDRTVKLGK